MKRETIIMNFTNVYVEEHLTEDIHATCIDCRHIAGTDCYCDANGRNQLEKLIHRFSVEGIHWIDSGNFHYMTELWTNKIKEPFSLILFDHHPDMQPTLFTDLLSCGNWVLNMLENNILLQKVCIIGASDSLRQEAECFGSKVAFFGETEVSLENDWELFSNLNLPNTPVYLSVDKDVLLPQYAKTNWDQGTISLAKLEELLFIICHYEKVIGIDICGELPLCEGGHITDYRMNEKANVALQKILEYCC